MRGFVWLELVGGRVGYPRFEVESGESREGHIKQVHGFGDV